jgi:hypothetical protein
MERLRDKYGWTFRGAYDETGRRIMSGARYLKSGTGYAASPVMWAGRKFYENPMGTTAMVGAGALGAVAGAMLPAAYVASPLLTYGMPIARHFATKYIPIKSNRFTRGMNSGLDMAMTGLSLATASGVPSYIISGAIGALHARKMYTGTKRTR